MRHFVDGENWYDPEDDGRWAGPGEHSSLRLPRLGKGRYRLELEVVDAMAADMVRQMRVSVAGAAIAVRRRSKDSLAGPLAPLKRAYLTHYKGRQLYPVRVSGIFDVTEEKQQSPLQVELSFPRLISPADRGQPDYRKLAVRVSQVVVAPC
jgi:hypothetical protein